MLSECAEASRPTALEESGHFGALDLPGLLNAIPQLVVILDCGGRIRGANAAACDLLGLTPDAVLGRTFYDLIHIAEHKALGDALGAFANGTATQSSSLRLRVGGMDHMGRPVLAAVHPYRSGSEALCILIGREEAQSGDSVALVAEANWRGRQLGQWRYDLNTRVQTLSEAVGRYIGHAGCRVVEDFGLADVHPDDRDGVRAVYLRAISERSPFFYRCRTLGRHGKYRLFESYGIVETDETGEATALVGVSCDISRASEAASALHDSVGELQEIFSEISDYIIRIDARHRVLYVSPSVTRVLGYEPADLLQKDARDLTHPDDLDHTAQAVQSLQSVGQSVSIPSRMLHRDGHWVWIEATVRALLVGPDGRPAETVAVCRDITQRRRAEEELAAAYARAEAASATKSRFLANMSHELRTPLNAIIGFSDIIRRELFGPVGAARYKEYAQLIQESGGHLLDLINDILDMSKIEAGKFDLRIEPLELDDLIRSCLKLLEPRAQQAKLVLTAELGDDKTQIQADRRAIKQILLNLLTNAIKFTPPGGVVTTSLQPMSDGIALQVRDTGVGIAEKDLPRVTLPFEQVTHDPLLAQAGSGLGLALVQSLVGLHMGTLKIDSAPGEGTLVTVFLPTDPRSRRAA